MNKRDTRPLAARLWTFQGERAPLFGMLLTASLAMGVVYNFSGISLRHYLIAVAILVLYFIQIRTADEKKDFEHDNRYHPTRPVQRGVVSLAELQIINLIAIGSQLALYASFMDSRIFLLGLLSQGYAFLTRKEFFVRDWIRQHFFTYYALHYLQLVILFYALVSIIGPTGISYTGLVAYAMLGVVMSELGRKMFAIEDDTVDDTYSAQLGHRGSALTLASLAVLINLFAWYFIQTHDQNYIYQALPLGALAVVWRSAWRYARHPHRPEARAVENAANLLMIIAMVAIILGA